MLTANDIIEKTKNWAQQNKVDAEALIFEKESFKISYNKGEVDEFSSAQDNAVGFRVIQNKREGTAYSESFLEEDVESAFKEACTNAEFVEKDYEPRFVEGSVERDNKQFFSEGLKKTSIDQKMQAAKRLEDIALKFDSRIKGLPYNGYNDFESSVTIFNTKGTHASYSSNGCYVFSYTLASEKDRNGMALEADVKKTLNSLDIERVAEQSAERALKKLGAQKPKTSNMPILLNPSTASTFIGLILKHFNLQNVDKGESLLGNKIDQKIFSKKLSLIDDPFYKGAMGSRPFDSEGTPSTVTNLVEKGVLRSYLTNSVYARKFNHKNTANASRSPHSELSISPSNVVIEPGTNSYNELLSIYPKVIVIDELKGLAGVNHISGDFSIQSEGHYYEDGQFKFAVNDFVISGNLVECLNKVTEIGNDVDINPFSSVISPSILISEVSVAGKS